MVTKANHEEGVELAVLDDFEEPDAKNAERRALVVKTLSGLSRVRPLPPQGGFFAMVDNLARGLELLRQGLSQR